MDFKNFSPAYLSSLAAIIIAALLIGTNSWATWLGWVLLMLALGLNVFAHLVTISKVKGGSAPAVLVSLDEMESALEQRIEAMREKAADRRDEQDQDPVDGNSAPRQKTLDMNNVLPSRIEDEYARSSRSNAR